MTTGPFNIHDDNNDQLEVPVDIIPQILEFHHVRVRMHAALKEEQAIFVEAQLRLQQRVDAINAEMDAAILKARALCVEHGLVGKDENFFLDTSRIVKHRKAYVVKPPLEGQAPVHMAPRSVN